MSLTGACTPRRSSDRSGVGCAPRQVRGHPAMLPLTDDNPRVNPPIVTVAIIIACVAVFLWQASLGERGGQLAVLTFGLIPARLLGEADLPSQLTSLPPWLTVFTSMFMHGDILH